MDKLQLILEKLKQINFSLLAQKDQDQHHPLPYSDIESNKKPNLAYHIKKTHSPVIFITTIVSFTSIVGYRFYNQPKLAVNTIATETIIAPTDGFFEDLQTTEEKRKQAKTGVIPVLKVDPIINQQIHNNLKNAIDQINLTRQAIGFLPFVTLDILSLKTQDYLRSCSEKDWLYLDNLIRQSAPLLTNSNHQLIQAFFELKSYQNKTSPLEFSDFFNEIRLIRQRYQEGWHHLAENMRIDLTLEEKELLLTLNHQAYQEIQSQIFEITQMILTQGIPEGLPKSQLEETIDLQLHWRVKNPTTSILKKILLATLQPNLIENTEETKARAQKAVEEVETVIVKIKQGDIIVKKGDVINQSQFVLLDGFNLSRRTVHWQGLIITGLFVSSTVGLFAFILHKTHRSLRMRDYVLLFLLSLAPPLTAIANIPYSPLPVIGFLVSSFYNPVVAITHVSLSTTFVAWTTGGVAWDYLMAGAIGGMVAGAIASNLRSREELAFLGMGVGLAQGGTFLILNLIPSAAIKSIWTVVLLESGLYGLSGVAWCILALGISPYLEKLFDLITPIRLAELCNPNRPLLKRLATETPGTFQHTLFVASLAEAAARELHCNVELVRAGTLYHDIGKMHDPLGFIENQMGGPNKHDQICDPWISAQIIKKHVSQGLVMAKKYGLPKAIRDFIPEHQGTLLISYFYFQAKEQENQGHKSVYEGDFRYDGPIPQSREAGILMLADGSEAALRSLKDVTTDQALKTLKKIFKTRWQDGQLVDSGLKWEELPIIADVFVKVWQQFNHQRIAYPKAALEPFSQK